MSNSYSMRTAGPILLLVSFIVLFQTGCKKENEGKGTSTHGSTAGSGMSGNCQECHVSGNGEAGAWTVAGTVFNMDLTATNPNGTLYIWKVINGTWKVAATLEVDANGNFYTSSDILPAGAFYPQIEGTSGDVENMPSYCTSGSCNSCHGVTVAKIWVK